MKTPTEVQADIIRELEAKVSLLLDDLFYTRAEIAKMPSDIYLCPPTSENDYEGLKWCDAYEELKRENAAMRKAKDILELERCEMMRTMSLLCNQAEQLQDDKERLDWLIKDSYYHFFFKLSSDLEKGRRQIDAARKEAQP